MLLCVVERCKSDSIHIAPVSKPCVLPTSGDFKKLSVGEVIDGVVDGAEVGDKGYRSIISV